ncbi:hypothetical protein, partial [Acinetobacter baumannii]|uniref:hypothetical protein n=1 Tax=Acinetobacter baumannii TaxID=470 RepID=UPI000D50E1AC
GVNDETITVNANALGNSKVTLKGTGYTLAPGSDVATTSTNSYTWIPSGTSAKYQLTESEYYTCDGSSINYVKPKITVVATISGLNKNFSVNDLGVNDKTITVNA